MPVFRNDDGAYHTWLGDNPGGLVVNARAVPDANYLVLHRAACRSITRPRDDAAAYTGNSYIKLAGRDEAELLTLIAKVTGKAADFSKRCGLCKP